MSDLGRAREERYVLAVKGDCVPNPGPGGWAAEIWRDGSPLRLLEGRAPSTTIFRMELEAALAGVGHVPAGERALLLTTSTYLEKGLGGRKPDREGDAPFPAAKQVKNRELWTALLRECGQRDVSCRWVRKSDRKDRFSRVSEAAIRMRLSAAPSRDDSAGGDFRAPAPPASPPGRGVLIHTDGSCLNNPGPGGWGAVVVSEDRVESMNGQDPDTTNNRMEMRAVIESLKKVADGMPVAVYTDSTYVQLGMTKWSKNWVAKGLFDEKSDRKVKNADLWLELLERCAGRDVSWNWVRGHDGDKYNEMAHELALSAAREAAASR